MEIKANRRQVYQNLHLMEGNPWVNLQAAVIFQAFDDYVDCCKVLTGKIKHSKNGNYALNPRRELRRIREYLAGEDSGSGMLTRALEEYMAIKNVRDVLKN